LNDLQQTSQRKKEHLELCINDDVGFKTKTSGFEMYDFVHYAITEIDINKIDFSTKFFNKKIDYPFLISCMTGGTEEAENINAQLAVVAEELKIPIGVGSQRQALENKQFRESYKAIRKNAPTIQVLGNLGAAEIVKLKSIKSINELIDLIAADAFVIHVNPLQELIQPEGTPYFKGLLKSISKLVKEIEIPVIVKEVGSGINSEAAEKLLDVGVKGIDVAGAGGTSWAGVEMLRKKTEPDNYFWDWGIPTSFCIKDVYKLKKKHKFTLIGSGGINSAVDAAKALALGADVVASARTILKELDKTGIDGTKVLIKSWFEVIKKIMFLTGSQNLKEFRKKKILRKEVLF
jgi:isopentenyl-diphosphate delta-isomerase